jgi:hypothetical protein
MPFRDRKYAVETPIIPPPIITTSASAGQVPLATGMPDQQVETVFIMLKKSRAYFLEPLEVGATGDISSSFFGVDGNSGFRVAVIRVKS